MCFLNACAWEEKEDDEKAEAEVCARGDGCDVLRAAAAVVAGDNRLLDKGIAADNNNEDDWSNNKGASDVPIYTARFPKR